MKKCPKCKKRYKDQSAGFKSNAPKVCPSCLMREAIDAAKRAGEVVVGSYTLNKRE